MAAILLDIDGVFHVSGDPIAGGADAVRRLREAGHRLRFVTNNTTRARATLAEELMARGHRVTIFTRGRRDASRRPLTSPGPGGTIRPSWFRA